MAGLTSRSYTTTSAFRRASSPFRVSRPGSPGPAPTRITFPGMSTPPFISSRQGDGQRLALRLRGR